MEPNVTVEPSLGELLDQALIERLVEQCSIDVNEVVIRRGHEEFAMCHDEARAFLLGLLLGHWQHAVVVPEEERGARRTLAEEGSGGQHDLRRLDRLVPLAKKLDLIEGVVLDEEEGEVVLVLPDVRASMSLQDAAEYLETCIKDRLPNGTSVRGGRTDHVGRSKTYSESLRR